MLIPLFTLLVTLSAAKEPDGAWMARMDAQGAAAWQRTAALADNMTLWRAVAANFNQLQQQHDERMQAAVLDALLALAPAVADCAPGEACGSPRLGHELVPAVESRCVYGEPCHLLDHPYDPSDPVDWVARIDGEWAATFAPIGGDQPEGRMDEAE